MFYLIVYLILCCIWGGFAVYKTRSYGYLGKKFYNKVLVFIINFTLFPYCFYYAIKHKKI